MIKIKLSDNQNIKCFSGLILSKDILTDYSIQLTDSNDYDYEFLGSDEFLNLSIPLNKSIDWGLENLSKKTGDYFLFHGGDSHRLWELMKFSLNRMLNIFLKNNYYLKRITKKKPH